MTSVETVHAVIGGFHLTGAKPEIIAKTIADVKAMRPEYVVPTHCSGFETIAVFAQEMPDPFLLNTAGTRYNFEAQCATSVLGLRAMRSGVHAHRWCAFHLFHLPPAELIQGIPRASLWRHAPIGSGMNTPARTTPTALMR
jgi:hypothetical protein